jgi:hypothetical protein
VSGQAHAITGAIEAHMAAELRFVFRHFPMTTVHPHAQPAAEAAEAARARGASGRFMICCSSTSSSSATAFQRDQGSRSVILSR